MDSVVVGKVATRNSTMQDTKEPDLQTVGFDVDFDADLSSS